jgi:gamma-glutamylcyclotransferase (GGCT)/AIG2-like uncharacterized protein YtfP
VEQLFSYGTLQREQVQLKTFGRRLFGDADSLIGYRLVMITVTDEEFVKKNGAVQRNVVFTGHDSDVVEGVRLSLTKEELDQADAYEPAGYERVQVQLRSGAKAWCYTSKTQPEEVSQRITS